MDARDEVVVLPPAAVDLLSVDILAQRLEQACALGPRRVVIDVAGVSFCDVLAVTVLLRAAEALRVGGCHLQVRNPDRFLIRVVDLLGVRAQLRLASAA